MAAKPWHRLKLIGFNTLYSISGQLSGFVLSLVVIRIFADRLWGEYSSFSIWLLLPLHIAYFGNKDYLTRAFSITPSAIRGEWSKNFKVRILLLLPILVITFILARYKPLAVDLVAFCMLRFVCQSFDSLVVCFQRFSRAVSIELGALFLVLGACFLFKYTGRRFGIDELIEALMLAEAGKGICYLITFRKYITLNPHYSSGIGLPAQKADSTCTQRDNRDARTQGLTHVALACYRAVALACYRANATARLNTKPPDLTRYLPATLPFFLIGLTGMLASKADLIFSNFWFNSATLARYQVLTNFLLLVQTGSAFILQPFVRNLYRLKKELISKIGRRLMLLGIPATGLGLGVVYLMMEYVYRFHFSPAVYAAGCLMAFPVYAYSPAIYYLYREQKQKLMLMINLFGIVISLGAAWVMFTLLSPQPLYLLLGVCVQQWFVLVVVRSIFRKMNASQKR